MSKRKISSNDPAAKKRGKSSSDKNSEQAFDSEEVDCVICGSKMQLNQLVAHQKTIHMDFQPKSDVTRCVHCQYPMPVSSLGRHLRRKHPDKFKLMKAKSTNLPRLRNPAKVIAPSKTLVQEPSIENDNDKDDVQAVQHAAANETRDQYTLVAYPPRAELSTARDEYGFAELVIIEF